MNICEGLCYALFATLATLIVGLSGYLVRECRIDKVDNAKEKYQP